MVALRDRACAGGVSLLATAHRPTGEPANDASHLRNGLSPGELGGQSRLVADPVEFHPIIVAVRPTRVRSAWAATPGGSTALCGVLEVLSVTRGGARDIVGTADDDGAS